MSKQTLPQHANPTNDDRIAVAPYNFVPLPEKVVPAEQQEPIDQSIYHADRHTGRIACTLTTASPLYVRCALTTAQFKQAEAEKRPERIDEQDDWRQLAKNTPDFFYTADVETPVIPGSSLRGMLRALVEIASYSKMSRVTKERLFFRTVDDTSIGTAYGKRMTGKVRGGWLTLNGRAATIEEVLVYKIPHSLLESTLPNGRYDGKSPNLRPKWDVQQLPVFIQVASYRTADANAFGLVTAIQLEDPGGSDWVAGTLVITGDIPKKKHEFVFVKRNPLKQWSVNEEVVRRFHDDDQITLWQRNAFPKDKPQGANRQRKGMLPRNVPEPVFFLLSDEAQPPVVFFGRAGMFRLPYLHSPYDLVPAAQPLPETDLAEAIFGHVTIHTNDTRAPIAGRVSVSDATYTSHENQLWLADSRITTLTPRILSSPKPTSFQHYLVQDKVNGQPRADDRKRLAHYDSSPAQTLLRGHKLYWHQRTPTRAQIEESTSVRRNDTQHTQFRPVNSGVTFTFDIHFENLSKVELGALLWVMRLCDDSYTADKDGPYRFKLGMGKPLGMGTVNLTTTSIKRITPEQRYTTLLDDAGWSTGEADLTNDTYKSCLDQFEQYVLKHSGERARGYGELAGTLRMHCLLALLRWPGLTTEQTACMGLSQFRYRPVLPTPLGVIGEEPPQPTLPPEPEDEAFDSSNVTPVETRMRGTVIAGTAPGQPGRIAADDQRRYDYDIEDIIGVVPTIDHHVLFRPGKKKVKQGKDKKNINWAYDVEVKE